MTAHTRTDGENRFLFVENYSEDEVKDISLNGNYEDMLGGGEVTKISLPAYGFAILKSKIQ